MEHSKSEYKRLSIQNPQGMADHIFKLEEDNRHLRETIVALEAEIETLKSIPTEEKEYVTVTTTLLGECVAVTMQNIEGQIKKVIWSKAPVQKE